MKSLIITSTALIVLLVGCPDTKPTPEPTPPVVEVEPTPELPMCVIMYVPTQARIFWRAIKTPVPEGKVYSLNESQRYSYELCGRFFHQRPANVLEVTDRCDVIGETVMTNKRGNPAFWGVEVNEYCRDTPIDGACEGHNCETYLERAPYPPTCTVIATRRLGTCDAMWNISTETGRPL